MSEDREDPIVTRFKREFTDRLATTAVDTVRDRWTTAPLKPCPRCGHAPDQCPNWYVAKIGCSICSVFVTRPWTLAETASMTTDKVRGQWDALDRPVLATVALPSDVARLKTLFDTGMIETDPAKTLVLLLRHVLGMDGDPIYSAQIRAILRGPDHVE